MASIFYWKLLAGEFKNGRQCLSGRVYKCESHIFHGCCFRVSPEGIVEVTVYQFNYVFRAKKHHAVYFNDLKEASTNNKGVINHPKCVLLTNRWYCSLSRWLTLDDLIGQTTSALKQHSALLCSEAMCCSLQSFTAIALKTKKLTEN